MDFLIGQYVFQGKEREKNKKGRKCRRSQIAQRATTFEKEHRDLSNASMDGQFHYLIPSYATLKACIMA
jgi:hypothetical protein